MANRGRPSVHPLGRTRSIVLATLSTEVILLAGTGVALYFVYRPTDAMAWNDIRVSSGSAGLSQALRVVHRLLGYLAVATALVAAVLVGTVPPRSGRWAGPLLGAGLVLASAVALYTGYLLPWEQLALWAVTVGTNMTGYGPLLGNQVRFVLMDNAEVAPGAVITWLAVHAALGGPVAGLLLALAWRRHRPGSGKA